MDRKKSETDFFFFTIALRMLRWENRDDEKHTVCQFSSSKEVSHPLLLTVKHNVVEWSLSPVKCYY